MHPGSISDEDSECVEAVVNGGEKKGVPRLVDGLVWIHASIKEILGESRLVSCSHLATPSVDEPSRDNGDCLKHCRGIRKPEWQNLVFEMTIASPECSLSFITLLDAKPMICSSEIQLGVPFDRGQSIDGFPNKRERVPVFDRNYIQPSIVYAESQALAGVSNKQDR